MEKTFAQNHFIMMDRSRDQSTIEKTFAQNHFTMMDRSRDQSTMEKTFAPNHFTMVDDKKLHNLIFSYDLKKTESEFLQVAATRECNFTMGTILGKGFAQALVHTVNSTRAFGTRAIDSMHLCLSKTLSQNSPHAEIAFSISRNLKLIRFK